MAIWYLIIWGALAAPHEAGQYQTRERCELAAREQIYGQGRRLWWKCELRIGSQNNGTNTIRLYQSLTLHPRD